MVNIDDAYYKLCLQKMDLLKRKAKPFKQKQMDYYDHVSTYFNIYAFSCLGFDMVMKI